jgi:hypothetical protein
MLKVRILALLGLSAMLAGCATPTQVKQREDLLGAAGFTVVPADSTERQASLATLPAHRFVHQVRNNVPVIVYSDPTICDCLYVGDQAALDRYRQAMKARNVEVAEERSANVAKMDWGAWPAFGP